jgi:hypothetical protein
VPGLSRFPKKNFPVFPCFSLFFYYFPVLPHAKVEDLTGNFPAALSAADFFSGEKTASLEPVLSLQEGTSP